MKLNIVLFLCLIKTCIGGSFGINFDACDAKSSNLNDCLKTSIQKYFRLVDKPVPQDSFAELYEPFRAQPLIIGPGKAQLNLTDIETYGWAQIDVDQVRFDLKTNEGFYKGRNPQFKIKGNYHADGKVLGNAFKGEGPCTTILENVSFTMTFKLDVLEEMGLRLYKALEVNMKTEPERVRFEFGNQKESFNKEINEQSKDFFAEVKSDYEDVLAAAYKQMLNFMFTKVPVKFFLTNA